jgi:hypothetical protein
MSALDRDDFLRRRVPGGRLMTTGAVAQLFDAIAMLERAARPLVERPPKRLAHILEVTLGAGDRQAIGEAAERIGAVERRLRDVASLPPHSEPKRRQVRSGGTR